MERPDIEQFHSWGYDGAGNSYGKEFRALFEYIEALETIIYENVRLSDIMRGGHSEALYREIIKRHSERED